MTRCVNVTTSTGHADVSTCPPVHETCQRTVSERGDALQFAAPEETVEFHYSTSSAGVTVSTFNLWCPAYRRLQGQSDDVRESQFPERYYERNHKILQLPQLWAASDIICLQEFWYSSAEVFDLYVKALAGRYRLHGLQRAGPGGIGRRPDGLFMAISKEWEVVHEV